MPVRRLNGDDEMLDIALKLLFVHGSRAHLMPTFDNIKSTLQTHWEDQEVGTVGRPPSEQADT